VFVTDALCNDRDNGGFVDGLRLLTFQCLGYSLTHLTIKILLSMYI
jgi:hypothetical protein